MPKNVTDQDFNKEVIEISQNKPVLVDFWAPWCGPCKAMAPVLEQVEETLGEAALIAKVDVDENSELSSKYGIQSIPCLKIFRNGEEVDEIIGMQSMETLVSKLNEHK